jgi:hypothetical protein
VFRVCHSPSSNAVASGASGGRELEEDEVEEEGEGEIAGSSEIGIELQ